MVYTKCQMNEWFLCLEKNLNKIDFLFSVNYYYIAF